MHTHSVISPLDKLVGLHSSMSMQHATSHPMLLVCVRVCPDTCFFVSLSSSHRESMALVVGLEEAPSLLVALVGAPSALAAQTSLLFSKHGAVRDVEHSGFRVPRDSLKGLIATLLSPPSTQ